MKILDAQLAASAVKRGQYPEVLPQVALFGRSNAGKSSLINVLINRSNLARTSSAPGKTRLINFYRVRGRDSGEQEYSWYFVDMPGYGYAKVAQSERAHWLDFMDEYLRTPLPRVCWQLVDVRHAPSRDDVTMHDILTQAGFRVLVVANKLDKISRSARLSSLKQISVSLGVDKADIVAFSALSREGAEELLSRLEDFLRQQAAPPSPAE